jgi:hypothetical protein
MKLILNKATEVMKSTILTFSLASALLLTACEETIDLELDQTASKIVIEGQVTDVADHNYVKVSRTVDFYSTGNAPRVTNATVRVEDNAGNSFSFVHYQGESPDSVGMYFPEATFAGEIGRVYKLTVDIEGQTYTAQDTLFRIVPIDKLESQLNEDEQADPEDPGRFYEVLLFVKEPQDTEDYYLFKFYRNGVLEYGSEIEIYFSDDKLLAENIDGIPTPIFYAKDDIARVEAYSLTRDAFIFYRDLQKLLNNDGGMFGTPPANPRSNLSNGAAGFFQVSAIQSDEITVVE